MTKELTVYIGNEKLHLFLKPGFFNPTLSVNNTHHHQYSEIHLMVSGQARCRILHQHIEISEGDMLVIPPRQMHNVKNLGPNTQRITFQISKPIDQVYCSHPGKALASLLANEIQISIEQPENPRLGYYMALLSCELPGCKPSPTPKPLLDRGFMITEFFSNHYHEDVSLGDLAALLNVSEKQAARLTQKYTGNNFRTELTRMRMEAAKYLVKETDISLENLAEQVGYKSYSGFWRAFRKQETEKKDGGR